MEPKKAAAAWQPFTPRGVAAFAGARLSRLLAVQGVVALCSALVAIWVISHTWFQAIDAAIEQLPRGAEIRHGLLAWPGPSPQRLADNPFLALSVDLDHNGRARSPAHLIVEFGSRDVRILSLFGYLSVPYPAHPAFAFSREELQPAWGAWSTPALALAALGIFAGLLGTWACLASVYAGPIRLTAFFLNRTLSWRGSWLAAGAGLMPGAVFMTATLALYGAGACDPVRLLIAGAAHFVIGICFGLAGAFMAPRATVLRRTLANPFAPPPSKAA